MQRHVEQVDTPAASRDCLRCRVRRRHDRTERDVWPLPERAPECHIEPDALSWHGHMIQHRADGHRYTLGKWAPARDAVTAVSISLRGAGAAQIVKPHGDTRKRAVLGVSAEATTCKPVKIFQRLSVISVGAQHGGRDVRRRWPEGVHHRSTRASLRARVR